MYETKDVRHKRQNRIHKVINRSPRRRKQGKAITKRTTEDFPEVEKIKYMNSYTDQGLRVLKTNPHINT